MYEILTSKEFFDKYEDKLVPGEFKFITKAFRQSDKTVALFEKENTIDCYFQMPGYKSTKVPENRKHIYKLSKGSVTKDSGFLLMDDGRYKIPMDKLDIWDNPYSHNDIVFEEPIRDDVPNVYKTEMKESLIDKLTRLDREVDEKVKRLESAIEALVRMEEKIIKTLEKLNGH
jgi:hypothetical protein